jgi:hypothetical protein
MSATEEVLSASNSYTRDCNENLSPQARHGEKNAHDSSMPQLTAKKD